MIRIGEKYLCKDIEDPQRAGKYAQPPQIIREIGRIEHGKASQAYPANQSRRAEEAKQPLTVRLLRLIDDDHGTPHLFAVCGII